MTGVAYTVRLDADLAVAALQRLSEIEVAELAAAIGEMVVGQTRNRILDEKTSPEGAPWAPWSKRYAAGRDNRHSLLVGRQTLHDSIASYSAGNEARVGTNMVYGAIHQFGGRGIPARPYLGLSKQNVADIREVVIDHVLAVLE